MKKLRLKYGMEGYGVYWYCLELIAKNVEEHNLSFELEEDAELISSDTGIYQDTIQEMMTFMVNLGLFEQSENRITCLKMSTRTDEYTRKLIKKTPVIRIDSGHTPDTLRTKSGLLDKNRIDKNITDTSQPLDSDTHQSEDKKKHTPFVPPTISEITNYFLENSSTADEANKFNYFYDSNGWKVGKNKMKKWRSSAGGWIARNPAAVTATGEEFFG